jgi:hypothetical protein
MSDSHEALIRPRFTSTAFIQVLTTLRSQSTDMDTNTASIMHGRDRKGIDYGCTYAWLVIPIDRRDHKHNCVATLHHTHRTMGSLPTNRRLLVGQANP